MCHEQPTNQAPRSSQSTSAQTADFRSQEKSVWRREEKMRAAGVLGGKSAQEISLLLRILSHRFCRFLCSEGDPKSRRSHPTRAPLPREKQKSGAAIGIWRVSDPAKEIPFFSETRHLRILSAVADPHFAVPEFCGAGSMPSRSRTDRNLDRQNPKGRCRILWLWDLEQNS